MKIHISFDALDLERIVSMGPLVAPFADGIEIGPLLLVQHGIAILDTFKKTFPNNAILADTRILDNGKTSMHVFITHKPNWITVMAGAQNETIHAVSSTAHEMRIKVMMNLLDAAAIGQSAMEAKNLGVDALVFHQVYTERDQITFLDKWDMVKENTKLPVFIATNITRTTIKEIIALQPDGIVINASVLDVKKPEVEAKFFYDLCHQT